LQGINAQFQRTIEFVHPHLGCIITQREVGMDTESYEVALKNTSNKCVKITNSTPHLTDQLFISIWCHKTTPNANNFPAIKSMFQMLFWD
jgi:hypothetical protein